MKQEICKNCDFIVKEQCKHICELNNLVEKPQQEDKKDKKKNTPSFLVSNSVSKSSSVDSTPKCTTVINKNGGIFVDNHNFVLINKNEYECTICKLKMHRVHLEIKNGK